MNENALTPDTLKSVAQFGDEGRTWLDALPPLVDALCARWQIEIDTPLPLASCSFVARVRRTHGDVAVLKIPIPHREAEHEPAALRAWDGDGAVKLFELDESGAMLLEAADPGTPLGDVDDLSRIAATGGSLLRRLHRPAAEGHPFELLADVCAEWAQLARDRVRSIGLASDRAIVDEGAELLEALPLEANTHVLLHGDFHHWNVLSATREPWLVIDPKPMVGDPVFDAARFLQNHWGAVHRERGAFVRDLHVFAEHAALDVRHILLWTFAREVEDSMWELSVGNEAATVGTIEFARVLRDLLHDKGDMT